MPVIAADISFKKSIMVSDLSSNGGRKGQVPVVSNARHSLFPRVTKTERTNGVTRYRKQFWCNENADDDIAYGVLQWLETISNAGDHFYIKKGEQTDVQGDLTSPGTGIVPLWTGTGQLNTLLSGGETEVILDMESNDFVFETGSYFHISNKVRTSQTIDSTVVIGDSVQFVTDTWVKISTVSSITYPYGVYLGDNKVLTLEETTNEEWVTIADRVRTDESVGTGDGTTTPTISALSDAAMGVHQSEDYLPILETVDATDSALTMYFHANGVVDTTQGDGASGELNMSTGAWTVNPTWNTPPKSGADITCTYRENPFSYSSNTVTVYLSSNIGNAYAVNNTFGGGCVYADEVKSSVEDWTVTSSSGTYDDTSYPCVPHNDGAEEDTITITFTSGSIFSVQGTNLGSLGTGYLISANCSPTNPSTGIKMFTLSSTGWGGTWSIGDTITFSLHPAAQSVWLKEVVPSGTSQEANNLLVLGYYTE